MDYTLSELIEIDELQSLCESFSRLTGYVTAILDMEGNVLTATGWQDVCTRFHRCNPVTSEKCRESDVYLAGQLLRGEKFTMYLCKNGLFDVAVPLVIAEKQVGNLYSGQFLLAPPDLEFFRRQAAESGFDETSYIKAVNKVPVVTEEEVRQVMEFLCRLAEMIGRMGLAKQNARSINLVLENSPFVLFRWKVTEGWPVDIVSRNVCQFGYAPEELLSGAVSFESIVYPEDLDRVTRDVETFAASGTPNFQQEYRIVTKDGKVRWVEVRTLVERDSEGRIIFFQGVMIDITKRKEAELALQFTQFAVDHTRDAAYWTGSDGCLLYVNDASCRALGYTREELLTMSVADIRPEYPPETWPAHWQELRERKTYSFETIHKRKDGSVFPVEITVNHVLFGGKEYNCAFARDISERKRIEGELAKAQKLESVGMLAGGIAHDFNNILTGILGNVSLAKTLLSPQDKAYKHVANLELVSLRAKELTQQLLTFSQGGAPIRKRVCTAEMIRNSIRLVLGGLQSTCELAIPDDLYPVEADEGQIRLVINNIMTNADQAMPLAGIIQVSCENIYLDDTNSYFLRKGGYVRVCIKDQGMGIPEEYLGNIFDPYFTTKEKGRGLGLASAYAIIKNHDGYISVESQTGIGTTFSLYIPASDSAAVVPEADVVETTSGKGKILVMDDEEIVSMVAGEMLEHLGYDVFFAKDGDQALAMYTDALSSIRPFDAVIMDLTIPGGMGGKEAIRKIMEIDPNAKAIVSSGYSSDPVMADFRQYGFSGILVKPYCLEEMDEQLGKVLQEKNGP